MEYDVYTPDILRKRYKSNKDCCLEIHEIKKLNNINIDQPTPQDITENIVKFIIRKYDNDPTCKWSKSSLKRGTFYSEKYNINSQPDVHIIGREIFAAKRYFGVMYFLDMSNWLIHDIIVLWKVNVTNESPEWTQLKLNNTTIQESYANGKKPYISWKKIYEQIPDKCVKVYEGPFEGIF